MSQKRENRTRRFADLCNKSDPQEPIDPCKPIKPQKLYKRPGEKDACDPEEQVECDFSGLRNPDGQQDLETDPVDGFFRNDEISVSCNDIFGLSNMSINSEKENVLVRKGEFTSKRTQEEANDLAKNAALSRLECIWGNKKITINCEDKEGNKNDNGSSSVSANTIKIRFIPNNFPEIKILDNLQTSQWTDIASTLQQQADEQALSRAQSELDCAWVNDDITVFCFDQISNWSKYEGKDINGNISTFYITNDTYEKISDNENTVEKDNFSVDTNDRDPVDIRISETEEIVRTQIFDQFYQRQANELAKANALEDLDCFFENVKITVNCCEAFDPEDKSKNLRHEDTHLFWYYDSHFSSGNPPNKKGSDSQGLPSKKPKPGVFDNIQPYYSRDEDKNLVPWISGIYNADTETQTLDGVEATDEEIQKEVLDCKNDETNIDVERDSFKGNIFRTLQGFTQRCNNRFIDKEYDQDGVTIETAVVTSPNRGEAYQNATDLALTQLECSWSNDDLDAAKCEPDLEGNEVDTRSIGSESNPVNSVAAGQFKSKVSKKDANDQAKSFNLNQLDCFWSNDAYDIRCVSCQYVNNNENSFVNQAKDIEPVFYRATGTLHVFFDHCGRRLQNDMVYYYKLYEAEFQRRQLLSINERAFLSDINAYLLNPPEGINTINNPVTNESFLIPNYSKIPPNIIEDEENNYNSDLDPNEFFYNERKGMDFFKKDNGEVETDSSLYYDLDDCGAGEGDAFASHKSCAEYVQPIELRDTWAGAEQVVQSIDETNANVQVLIEIGQFTSRTSQGEANTLAEAFGLSNLECFYENDLLDVRCNDCDFGERELTDFEKKDLDPDVGVYQFQPAPDNNKLFFPDPKWSATNALIFEHECVFVKENFVRSGYDHRGNIIENKCNHAPSAQVRTIIEQGNFQSKTSKEEANEIAELFGNSQLNCFWENPEVRRYCTYCGFNIPGRDLCAYNPVAYDCSESETEPLIRFPTDDHELLCISCLTDVDCPDCYDPRNRSDNEDKNLWNRINDADNEGQGCNSKEISSVIGPKVKPKYTDISTDCCCSKYALGANTEVVIGAGSTNSKESLEATVDLSKNLGENNLNCLFGNDPFIISCERDFDGTRIVQTDNCLGKDDENPATVFFEVPKDANTSYKSFNEAQELAEKQAYEFSRLKCNAAEQWIGQTWKIDTGLLVGVKNLRFVEVGDTKLTKTFNISDAYVKKFNNNPNDNVVAFTKNPFNNRYKIDPYLVDYEVITKNDDLTLFLGTIFGRKFVNLVSKSSEPSLYRFYDGLSTVDKINFGILKETNTSKIVYNFDDNTVYNGRNLKTNNFSSTKKLGNFSLLDTDDVNLKFVKVENGNKFNDIVDLFVDNKTQKVYPDSGNFEIKANNTIEIIETTGSINSNLNTLIFSNTYCLFDCDWCLGPVVPEIKNTPVLKNSTINKAFLSNFQLGFRSGEDPDKSCGENLEIDKMNEKTKSEINSIHYRPQLPIMQVASVHVGGYQFQSEERYGSNFDYSNVPLAVPENRSVQGFIFDLKKYSGSKGLSLVAVERDCGDDTQDDYQILDNAWREASYAFYKISDSNAIDVDPNEENFGPTNIFTDSRIVYAENVSDGDDHVLQGDMDLALSAVEDLNDESFVITNEDFKWRNYPNKILNWYLCPFAYTENSYGGSPCSNGEKFSGLSIAIGVERHQGGACMCGEGAFPNFDNFERYVFFSNLKMEKVESEFFVDANVNKALNVKTTYSNISSPCVRQ